MWLPRAKVRHNLGTSKHGPAGYRGVIGGIEEGTNTFQYETMTCREAEMIYSRTGHLLWAVSHLFGVKTCLQSKMRLIKNRFYNLIVYHLDTLYHTLFRVIIIGE